MSILDKLNEYGDEFEGTVVFRNYDFETAIIGRTEDNRLIYDYDKMVEYLMEKDNIDEIEAMEFLDTNTVASASFMGDKSPIIMYRLPWDD